MSREYVPVPKDDLEQLLAMLRAQQKLLDKLGRTRVDVQMSIMRIEGWLRDPDKTPTRPPSRDDVEAAAHISGEFRLKDPRRE